MKEGAGEMVDGAGKEWKGMHSGVSLSKRNPPAAQETSNSNTASDPQG